MSSSITPSTFDCLAQTLLGIGCTINRSPSLHHYNNAHTFDSKLLHPLSSNKNLRTWKKPHKVLNHSPPREWCHLKFFLSSAWLKITHRHRHRQRAIWHHVLRGRLFLLLHMPITAAQQVTNYILILMRCCCGRMWNMTALLYTVGLLCLRVLFFGSFLTFCDARFHAAVIRGIRGVSRYVFWYAFAEDTERALRGTSLCHFLQRLAMQLHHFQVDTICTLEYSLRN